MNARDPNLPLQPDEATALARYAERSWDEQIVPALTDYIGVPAKSPMFDADWQAHGLLDRVVRDAATWVEGRKVRGLKLEVIKLEGRTPLIFFDVPATVAAAVRQLRNRGVTFATVHGNQSIMEAAAAAKGDVKVLAVTVLTSLDRGDLDDLGFSCDVEQLVLSRARRALACGVDGIVSSGLEAPMIRRELGSKLLVVTPGIRPVENKPVDDQKRTVDVAQAFRNGADYIVVGRPIRQAADPRAAAQAVQQTIAEVFR